MHGSASPHEVMATLIASGPSFSEGITLDLPSGQIDIAPTVLSILGQTVPEHMDGRVLAEALRESSGSAAAAVEFHEHYGKRFETETSDRGSRFVARTASYKGVSYFESATISSD